VYQEEMASTVTEEWWEHSTWSSGWVK